MNIGIVLWFNIIRGIGMITSGDRTVFVHHSNIISNAKRKNLYPGDAVEFDLYESMHASDKLEAKNVRKIL